jgi:hypothetical protein
VIGVMMLVRGQRWWLVLVLVVAIVAPGMRGLCFMPGTASGSNAGHDCCARGWTAAPPACCLEGRVDEVPAIRMAKQLVPAVSVIPTALLEDQDSRRLSTREAASRSSFHSPPIASVLRV